MIKASAWLEALNIRLKVAGKLKLGPVLSQEMICSVSGVGSQFKIAGIYACAALSRLVSLRVLVRCLWIGEALLGRWPPARMRLPAPVRLRVVPRRAQVGRVPLGRASVAGIIGQLL